MSRSMLQGLRNRFSDLDGYVANEAARRAVEAEARGVSRNKDFVMTGQPEVVAGQLASELGKDEAWARQMASRITMPEDANSKAYASRLRARRGVANHYGPGMNRGLGRLTQMGVMEAINTGIANNPYMRRGVLPAAIFGGGAMGVAAVTTAAQNLAALTAYVQGSVDQQERVEQSPLRVG